ncbi:MAG: hypothetical protein LBK13_12360 [Spirochaetales bacterium]|jgi:hypothetical protein|nr:hypothetical protein [Spirochaetales bacterium]
MKIRLLVIFTVLVSIGCTSVPVPTPEQNTLLVGKLLVNWDVTGKMSGGNGKIKFGIRTYFQNNQTGKIISVFTQKDGWFLTGKLTGGNYTIQKFYIEREQGNTIYQMTLRGPFYVTLEDGVVNNMGTIQIDIGNNNYTPRLVDYDVIRYDFQEEFPDSEWNLYEWKNNSMFDR